jgi:hypothetical protein
MNQIPQEGEYCGECPCLETEMMSFCNLYSNDVGQPDWKAKRSRICLKRRPIIIERNEEQ